MGIFIIKSLHSDWIRIGHQYITEKRPSVYYRFIDRGFYTVIRPHEIHDKVGFNDLQLIYWYNNLDKEDERRLLSQLRKLFVHNGKWYKYGDLKDILNIIREDYKGVDEMPSIDELNDALKWCDERNKQKYLKNKN